MGGGRRYYFWGVVNMKIKPFTKQKLTIPVGEVDLSDGFYFEVHLMQLETTVTRRPVLVTLNSLEDSVKVEKGAGSGCKVVCDLSQEQTAPFKGPHFPFHQDPENRCWAQVHYIKSDTSVVGMTDPIVVEVGDVIKPSLIEYKTKEEEEVEADG